MAAASLNQAKQTLSFKLWGIHLLGAMRAKTIDASLFAHGLTSPPLSRMRRSQNTTVATGPMLQSQSTPQTQMHTQLQLLVL
jgi:hypothetical protein